MPDMFVIFHNIALVHISMLSVVFIFLLNVPVKEPGHCAYVSMFC